MVVGMNGMVLVFSGIVEDSVWQVSDMFWVSEDVMVSVENVVGVVEELFVFIVEIGGQV